jgi:hypothetical protein
VVYITVGQMTNTVVGMAHRVRLDIYTVRELKTIAEWCATTFEKGSWLQTGVYPGWLNFKHGTDMLTFKLVWGK